MTQSEKALLKLREEYPEGCRIKLLETLDDPSPRRPVKGDCGNVIFVDDAGDIHVKWDKGSTLALIPEIDSFEKI